MVAKHGCNADNTDHHYAGRPGVTKGFAPQSWSMKDNSGFRAGMVTKGTAWVPMRFLIFDLQYALHWRRNSPSSDEKHIHDLHPTELQKRLFLKSRRILKFHQQRFPEGLVGNGDADRRTYEERHQMTIWLLPTGLTDGGIGYTAALDAEAFGHNGRCIGLVTMGRHQGRPDLHA